MCSSHIQVTHFASSFAWLRLDCKGQLKFFLAPYPFPLFTPLATATTVTTPHWYSDATQGCYWRLDTDITGHSKLDLGSTGIKLLQAIFFFFPFFFYSLVTSEPAECRTRPINRRRMNGDCTLCFRCDSLAVSSSVAVYMALEIVLYLRLPFLEEGPCLWLLAAVIVWNNKGTKTNDFISIHRRSESGLASRIFWMEIFICFLNSLFFTNRVTLTGVLWKQRLNIQTIQIERM